MKSLQKYIRKNQAGMTLTESLLVLSVGALVAVLAYGGYKMATNDVKTQSQAKATVSLAGKVKQVFSVSGDFSGAGTANVISAKLVPADFKIASATQIDNSWGGTVVLTGATSNFTIAVASIPQESCVEYLAGAASAGTNLEVGTSTKVSVFTGGKFDTSKAITECAKAATSTATLTVQ